MKVYTIADKKAECYSQPFYALTDQAAVRTFRDAVNTDDSPYNRHPEDYSLFSIADFDDRTGVISSHTVRHLGDALNLVREEVTFLETGT